MRLIPEYDASSATIWAAYGLAFLLICGAVIITSLRVRAARRRLDRLKETDKAQTMDS